MSMEISVEIPAELEDGEQFSLIGLNNVPVQCNVLHSTEKSAAACARGDIDLVFSPSNGLIYNVEFDADQMAYDVEYENALHHSPRFQEFAQKLAESLVQRHDLRGKRILEIGCGDGYFLQKLCEVGDNLGWGFDPSSSPDLEHVTNDERVTIVREYFESGAMSQRPQFVCCRHVLEHIPDPVNFLRQLRQIDSLAGATFYFEVPDARFTLQRGGYWDILYEHCSYFTDVSMSTVFRAAGFRVLQTNSTYDGQFLQIEAQIDPTQENTSADAAAVTALALNVRSFSQKFQATLEYWRSELTRRHDAGEVVGLWGAGTKGVMFLNLVDRDRRAAFVVDLNPKKHGCFIAGTGHPIVAPESLVANPPNTILLMNPAYRDEVAAQLKSLNIDCELLTV